MARAIKESKLRPGSAINQNAPEAIPPAPLAKEIRRAGMLYREFWRQGDVAIYCAKGKGARIEYEVLKVQILPAEEVNGTSYPAREGFPKNSDWGLLGFTYTNKSHRDPLAAALAKAQQIVSRSTIECAEHKFRELDPTKAAL
jgi:hypothetical protein